MLIAAGDLAAVGAAMGLAMWLATRTGFAPRPEDVARTKWAAVVSLPFWLFFLVRARLYQVRFIARRAEELKRVLRAAAAGALSLVVITDVWRDEFPGVQRDFVLFAFLCSVGTLTAERELVRQIFNLKRRNGSRLRPVVIVGDNAEAQELRAALEDRSLGYKFMGFVSVDPSRRGNDQHDVLGQVDDILGLLAERGIPNVMIAASAIDVAITSRLIRQLLKNGIHVELSPTLPDIAVERLTVRPLGRFPIMYLEPFHQSGWRSLAKRVFDLLVATAALVVLALPLLVLSLLIKLDSPGAVFYRQERVGRNNRRIQVLKFRTMVPNAHEMRAELADANEADGPLFKIENDPRITRVGRYLRKFSLDELPQLWNVVAGDMSLVGPRPALPEEAQLWSVELRDRLRVQPGITGMWQVSGRSSTSFEEYSRLDLYYVDNWSLLTDLAILAKTVPTVLTARGAS